MNRLNQFSANDSPEARRDFLRPLPQTAFIPPNLYTTAPTDAVKNLRSEVAAFAERFWSLPESERQSQWTALIERSGDDPKSRARLRRLEPAVTVPAVSKTNVAGEFGVIALALQEQFALLPAERAARREVGHGPEGDTPPEGGWEPDNTAE